MREKTLLQQIGLQVLLLNRKVVLEVMSLVGVLGMGIWMSVGVFSSDIIKYIVPPVSIVLFLSSFWAIRQYNYHKAMSYVFGIVISTLAICGNVLWGESHTGVLLFLFSPFLLFVIAGAEASIYAVVVIFTVTVALKAIGIGSMSIFPEWILLSIYLAQMFGLLIFASVADEYKSRLRSVKAEIRHLTDEYRAKENFIASLSHQIRTPLSTILGITDMMKTSPLNPAYSEMTEVVVTSANNLLTLSDEILQNANISIEGTQFSEGSEFDIETEVDEMIAGFNETGFSDTALELKISFSEYLPKRLSGDSAPLLKPLQGVIEVVAKKSPGSSASAEIYIYDKKETVSSIELLIEVHTPAFQGFTQERLSLMGVEKDSEELLVQKLGLEDAHDIVLGKGGIFNVRFTSANIAIVSFTVLFWKDNEDKLVIERIQQAVNAARKSPSEQVSNASILVVEDNLMNQKVVGMALKNRVKRIDFANNGKEAVKMFSNTKYDLILMDLMMPIMDGHKATAKIRELEAGTDLHTPIIALTANARAGVKEICMQSGMDDYLTKPFKFDSLIAKVEEYIFSIV